MELKMNLNLEQRQELIMTPRLQMAIELLHYSSLELDEYLQDKLVENPLLEKETQDELNLEARIESQYQSNSYSQPVDYSDKDSFENYTNYKPGLYEHLEKQLYEVLPEDDLKLGKYIISSLDQNGLLAASVEEIAGETGKSRVKVNEVLRKIQHLDPVGIGSRSIKESLLVQLETLGTDTWLAEQIIINCWDNLKNLSIEEIKKKFQTTETDVLQALESIKNLQSRPAASYVHNQERAEYIEPDIIIRKVKDRYIVELSQNTSPILSINPKYYRMMQQSGDEETKEFLQKKFKAAIWLIRAIEHRRMTLLKISRVLVEQQRDFLENGIKSLKPLTMQDVAQEIEMHESTVSRATTGKYIQTPRGLYTMKFFFASRIGNNSAASVKALLAEYIKQENEDKPLSDSKLADLLTEVEGIKLSRRTVAKYRNELEIPSSVQRKKWQRC
ncbi:MAG: RNA polymerase factor sigma-54 [Bacillota bacterium]